MAKPLVHFQITGSVETGLRFEQFPNDLRAALRGEIEALGREAFGQVAARVPRATGRLASQERLSIWEGPEFISARVDFDGAGAESNDHRKAGALEYGSRGKPIPIRAHQRRITTAWGKRLTAPLDRLVEAYERVPHVAARDFVRDVTAKMRGEALDRLEAVASQAVDKANKD